MNSEEKRWARLNALPPPSAARDDLSSTFGCCEMEVAAAKIIRQAREGETWTIDLSAYDFQKDDHEFIGFVLLVAHRWIATNSPSNDAFRIKPAFVRRVTEKRPTRQETES